MAKKSGWNLPVRDTDETIEETTETTETTETDDLFPSEETEVKKVEEVEEVKPTIELTVEEVKPAQLECDGYQREQRRYFFKLMQRNDEKYVVLIRDTQNPIGWYEDSYGDGTVRSHHYKNGAVTRIKELDTGVGHIYNMREVDFDIV